METIPPVMPVTAFSAKPMLATTLPRQRRRKAKPEATWTNTAPASTQHPIDERV